MKALYEMKARMITIRNSLACKRREIAELEEELRIILICIDTARLEMVRGGVLISEEEEKNQNYT